MPASSVAKILYRLGWLLLLTCTSLQADTFMVESAQISSIGNGYTLNAKINYPLTPRVKEALDNGVPITFRQQFKIVHSLAVLGDYWQWDDILWTSEIRYQLSYHALTEQFILIDIDTLHQRNFSSLAAALAAMGNIKNFNLPPEYLTETDHLLIQIRSGIDLNALPTPMRPGALISSKWQLTSPWFTAIWL
jgi:hypothetical protein